MYSVSDNYKTAVRAYTRDDKMTGTITFADGTVQNLTDADFSSGSISITHQCVEGEELMFGAAIIGELDISLRTDVDRYSFYEAVIELSYFVLLTDSTWEEVPLGIFTVTEAEREGALVNLVAYDNMQLLDQEYGSTAILGTPYEILAEICENVGLTLGIEEEDIEDWPNADQTIQIDSTNGCNSFREAVKIVCQFIGAFAEVNREGELVVKQFHQTSDVSLSEAHRYSLTLADYTCVYVALVVTGLAGTFEGDGTLIRTGLTMYMDDAPAWDYGIEETLQTRVQTLMDYLEDLSYTPCQLDMPGDPAFECGDNITFIVGEEEITSYVTDVTWNYHDQMQINSVGKNPYLNSATALASSQTRQLEQQAEANKINLYTTKNYNQIDITSSWTDLCRIQFAAVQNASAFFHASIILEVEPTNATALTVITNASFKDEDGNTIPITGTAQAPGYVDIYIKYTLDQIEVEYYPIEHYVDGKHTMILFYPIESVASQTLHNFRVQIKAVGGTAKVEELGLKGALFGQNLAANNTAWDGTIFAEDFYEPVSMSILDVPTITDALTTPVLKTPESSTFAETISRVSIPVLGTPNVTAAVSVSKVVLGYTIDTDDYLSMSFDTYYIKIEEGKYEFETDYTFVGAESTIDQGRLMVATANTSQFARVDSLEVI